MNRRLAEAVLALSLLTRLPLPRLRDCPPMGASAWAWPLAGIAVGAAQAGVLLAAGSLPPAIAAGLAVAAGLLLTGGLHEDGLADLADGLGGGRDAAHRLEIMKDSRIGSHGAVALIVALGLRWSALAVIAGWPPAPMLGTLVAVQAASRAGMGLMNRLGPQARRRGFAIAATEGLSPARAGAALALGAGLALVALPCGRALAALAAVAVVQAVLLLRARRALGGVSGDVLGAAQVAGEVAALALIAA